MGAARKVRLALDVDDTLAPEGDTRRDPPRQTERVVPEVVHREAVDLADHRPRCRYHQHVVEHHLRELRLGERLALAAFQHGRADVPAVDGPPVLPPRQVRRLAQDVRHIREAGRDPLAVAGEAHRFLHERCHAPTVERQQLLVADDLGHEGDEVGHLRAPVRHLAVEVGQHLEDLAELLVELVQHVVEGAVADHDDLDVDVHRFGLEGLPGDREQDVVRADHDAPVTQGTLQRRPHPGLRHGVERVHRQKTAVGAQERACADAHVVGGGLQVLADLRLDRPEEVVVRRLGLDDDRPALGAAAVHHHVDAVSQERVAVVTGLDAEKVEVRLHVCEELFQERRDAGVLDAFGNRAERLSQDRLNRGPPEILGTRDHLFPHHHHLVEGALQLLGELAVGPLDGRCAVAVELPFLGEALQLVEGDGPLLDDREDLRPRHRADLDLHEREPRLAHPVLEPFDELLLFGLEVLEGEIEPLLELLPLEDSGQVGRQIAQQLVEAVAQ